MEAAAHVLDYDRVAVLNRAERVGVDQRVAAVLFVVRRALQNDGIAPLGRGTIDIRVEQHAVAHGHGDIADDRYLNRFSHRFFSPRLIVRIHEFR